MRMKFKYNKNLFHNKIIKLSNNKKNNYLKNNNNQMI